MTTGRQLASLLLMASETCRKHVIVTLSSLRTADQSTVLFLDQAIREILEKGCKVCIILTGTLTLELEANKLGTRYTIPVLYWAAPREHYIVIDLLPMHVASGQADVRALARFIENVVECRQSVETLEKCIDEHLNRARQLLNQSLLQEPVLDIQTRILEARKEYASALFMIYNLGPFDDNTIKKIREVESKVTPIYSRLLELDMSVTERRFGLADGRNIENMLDEVLSAHENLRDLLCSAGEQIYSQVSKCALFNRFTSILSEILNELKLVER